MILDKAIQFIFSRPAIPSSAEITTFDYPNWLSGVDGHANTAQLEALLGITIPDALREFWTYPGLLARAVWYFNYDFISEPPSVFEWRGHPFLLFAYDNGHAGGILATQLDAGKNPPVGWGWDDDDDMASLYGETFDAWVDKELRFRFGQAYSG